MRPGKCQEPCHCLNVCFRGVVRSGRYPRYTSKTISSRTRLKLRTCSAEQAVPLWWVLSNWSKPRFRTLWLEAALRSQMYGLISSSVWLRAELLHYVRSQCRAKPVIRTNNELLGSHTTIPSMLRVTVATGPEVRSTPESRESMATHVTAHPSLRIREDVFSACSRWRRHQLSPLIPAARRLTRRALPDLNR